MEPKGVRFLAVSLEPDEKQVLAAVSALKLVMKVAITESEALAPLGVNQVPSTIFLDREGIIVGTASGERTEAFFRRHAQALLAK